MVLPDSDYPGRPADIGPRLDPPGSLGIYLHRDWMGMTKGIHRVPAGTKRGRQLTPTKGVETTRPRPDQAAWNAQVEARKQAKKAPPA